jgi:integrase
MLREAWFDYRASCEGSVSKIWHLNMTHSAFSGSDGGTAVVDRPPSFCTFLGPLRALRHNLSRRSFKPLLKPAELPEIRFHDLRHTCATLLHSKDVHPKFVQELLGHATIAITLDTYSHVLPGMGDQTASAMDSVLG